MDILQKLTDDLTERKDREALLEDGFSYVYAYSYDLEDKDPLEEIVTFCSFSSSFSGWQ